MCGIIGATGQYPTRDGTTAFHRVLNGLYALEYRGYDSAGIAVCHGEQGQPPTLYRAVGPIKQLAQALPARLPESACALGHTRWATHGIPAVRNAHPHQIGPVTLVHNGIVENYLAMKKEAATSRYPFASETDTEILAHMLAAALDRGLSLVDAIRELVRKAHGIYSLVAYSDHEPGTLVGCHSGNSLVVASSSAGEYAIASDVQALLPISRSVTYLSQDQIAVLRPEGVTFFNTQGAPIELQPVQCDWTVAQAEKQGYAHYMLKEIEEQPDVLANCCATFTEQSKEPSKRRLLWPETWDGLLHRIERARLIGCGTAYHASMIGALAFQRLASLDATAELASEVRYQSWLRKREDLALFVSQSGETLDTLLAARHARERGDYTVAICNTPHSALVRSCGLTYRTEAGIEKSVASTKAFTTQVLALTQWALELGLERDALSYDDYAFCHQKLREIPALVRMTLQRSQIIKEMVKNTHFTKYFFVGRQWLYPVALEGALKLKEITYLHAEGYAAGELKHGPIALMDRETLVVTLLPSALPMMEGNKSGHDGDDRHALQLKQLSTIQEVKSRGAAVLGLGDESVIEDTHGLDYAVPLPACHPLAEPIVYSVPLQLFAYFMAVERGCNVDQPRNLAKSVTVE